MTAVPSSLLDRIRTRVPDLAPPSGAVDQAQAAVLMAFTDASEPELILTRRAEHLSSHAGEVAFPGGKRDASDTDMEMTVLRESEEEIALSPSAVDIVGPLPLSVSKHGLQVVPFVGIIPHQTRLIPSEDEIGLIFQVPLTYFLEQPPFDHIEREVEGVRYRIPCFRFEGNVIWGLTAYFITDFCNRVFDTGFDFFRPGPVGTLKGDGS